MSFKVVCLNKDGWLEEKKNWFGRKKWVDGGMYPIKDEICTVIEELSKPGFYFLDEYGDTFEKSQFVPLKSDGLIEVTFEQIREDLGIPQGKN